MRRSRNLQPGRLPNIRRKILAGKSAAKTNLRQDKPAVSLPVQSPDRFHNQPDS
jgi:hypothetical protein